MSDQRRPCVGVENCKVASKQQCPSTQCQCSRICWYYLCSDGMPKYPLSCGYNPNEGKGVRQSELL